MGGGKSGGGGVQTFDYYGSIAGEICCERLDFICAVLKDEKIVWPPCKTFAIRRWQPNSYVRHGGLLYKTTVLTSAVPPAFPWMLVTDSLEQVLHEDAPPWSQNGWANGSCCVYLGRIWQTQADTNAAPPNAPWVLFRRDRTNTPNPFKFTIPNLCEAFLYWGTPTQVLDTVDEKFLSTRGHPPYRWRTVLALKKCLFGTEIQTAPNIAVLGGRAPQQSLIVGPATALDADWQANPWCVIAEMLTHPVIGLGRPLSEFHAESWQAQADWSYARASKTYISPYYDSQAKLRQIIPELLSYVDGFVFRNSDGLLQAGHWPHGEAPPAFTPSNIIDMHDLVDETAWDSDSFNGTTNATVVNFEDITAAFNTRPAQAPNLLNRITTQRANAKTIDRPFIVRADQAAAIAAEDAKLSGDPLFSGTLSVRAEKAVAITPGKLFQLTDDLLQMTKIVRCTSKTISAPPAGTVKLGFQSERGVSDQPYQATPENPDSGDQPEPAVITDFQMVQIPDALASDGGSSRLVALAARDNALTTSCGIWWRQAEEAEAFEQLALQRSFAVAGTASASINTTDVVNELATTNSTQGNTYPLANGDIWNLTLQSKPAGGNWQNRTEGADYIVHYQNGTVTIVAGGGIANGSQVQVTYSLFVHVALSIETPVDDLEAISATLTADEVNNDKLLLFAFHELDPHKFEIMSVKAIEAAGGGFYRIRVRRTQFGTLAGGDGVHVWNASDPVFIAFRSGLVPLSHESFPALAQQQATATFRLAPASAWVQADVEDVYDDGNNPGGLTTEFDYTFNNPYAPTVIWLSLQRNGNEISDFTAAFGETDQFLFTFKLADANGDLAQATLTARLGTVEQTLWSQTLTPGYSVIKAAQFSISYPGLWQIVCTVSDASGNVQEYPLTTVAGQDVVYLNIQGPLPMATSPVIYGYNVISGYICQLIFGWIETGLTVLYQVRTLSAPYDNAAWSVAPPWGVVSNGKQRYGTVPNFPRNRTLYAKVQKSGYADSAVVHWNF